MTRHIIYIPGLGDGYDGFRQFALDRWNRDGLTVELVPMQWNQGGSYADRKRKIEAAIDKARQAGHQVSVIGESAGASMAINVMVDHQNDITTLVTLCGVVSPTTPVSSHLRRRSPSFDESLKRLPISYDKLDPTKIITFSAIRDGVVRRRYSTIPGAANRRLPSIGHLLTISLALTVFKSRILRQIVTHEG